MSAALKEFTSKAVDDFPEATGWSEEQKERFQFALEQLTLSTILYQTTDEGSPEREKLDSDISYANMTLTALPALSAVKAQEYVKEKGLELFQLGVQEALSSLK